MKTYHKIQTVFLRNPENKHKTIVPGLWAKPEFQALCNIRWIGTEKIDGTNIRIIWDGESLRIAGKTDAAQIPPFLLSRLIEIFNPDYISSVFGNRPITLYGEGYGNRIQKVGSKYIADDTNFILFDAFVSGENGSWWLTRDALEEIAYQLNIQLVPVVFEGTLNDAVNHVRLGFNSRISFNELIAEGLILKPEVELFNRKGERVITKIKHKDFG